MMRCEEEECEAGSCEMLRRLGRKGKVGCVCGEGGEGGRGSGEVWHSATGSCAVGRSRENTCACWQTIYTAVELAVAGFGTSRERLRGWREREGERERGRRERGREGEERERAEERRVGKEC